MESVHCQQALAAAGFKRMERDYSDEPGDRTLRNIALVHGVREASYEKSEKKYVERVTVYMINELLFRVVVKYEDFVKGTGDIREKIIEEVSKKFHSTPYNVSGLESGIAVYSWTDGVTEARFVYRELPNIDFYFVEVDYYHIDTATKLKKARLLRH